MTFAIFAAGVTTLMSMYTTQALLPAISHEFGATPAAAALTVSLTTGLLALMVIPASVLSERFGRKRVMVTAALIATAIGLVQPMLSSLDALLVARALQGVALAGVPAVAMAYLAEEVEGHRLGIAVGRYVAGTTIGGLLGRLVPSSLVDIAGWRWAMELTAVVALGFAVVFVRRMPDSRHFTSKRIGVRTTFANLVGHLRNPALARLYVLAFLLMGGFVAVYNYLGYRLTAEPFRLPESVAGMVFALYLAGTISSALAGRFASRRALPIAVAGIGVGLLLTIPDNLALIACGVTLFTGSFFAAHSIASGRVTRVATEHRGEASALYLCAYYLGSSIAGLIGGVAFHAFGWAGLVGFVGVLVVAAQSTTLVASRMRTVEPSRIR